MIQVYARAHHIRMHKTPGYCVIAVLIFTLPHIINIPLATFMLLHQSNPSSTNTIFLRKKCYSTPEASIIILLKQSSSANLQVARLFQQLQQPYNMYGRNDYLSTRKTNRDTAFANAFCVWWSAKLQCVFVNLLEIKFKLITFQAYIK